MSSSRSTTSATYSASSSPSASIRDPRSNYATWSRKSGAVLPVDGGLTARLGIPDLA